MNNSFGMSIEEVEAQNAAVSNFLSDGIDAVTEYDEEDARRCYGSLMRAIELRGELHTRATHPAIMENEWNT